MNVSLCGGSRVSTKAILRAKYRGKGRIVEQSLELREKVSRTGPVSKFCAISQSQRNRNDRRVTTYPKLSPRNENNPINIIARTIAKSAESDVQQEGSSRSGHTTRIDRLQGRFDGTTERRVERASRAGAPGNSSLESAREGQHRRESEEENGENHRRGGVA